MPKKTDKKTDKKQEKAPKKKVVKKDTKKKPEQKKKKLSPRIKATFSLPINFLPTTKASGNPLGLACSA